MIEDIIFEETANNTCSVRLEHDTGETTIIEYGSITPLRCQEHYVKAIIYYLKNHPDFTDEDILGSFSIWSVQHLLEMPMGGFTYTNYDRIRIGRRIKELREEKHMGAKQLSMMSGIDASNLSRIEQGKYSVGLDVLTRLAKVLGCQVDIVKKDSYGNSKV